MIDWPSYNESLVRRGQVLLDFDVLDGCGDHELSQMKIGGHSNNPGIMRDPDLVSVV
ncbi:MAG: hypothetical protein WCA39_15425 [Nitrososphaeraceae archaeon]|jgi:hypothetical protein